MTAPGISTSSDVDSSPQQWPNPRGGLLFFLGFAAIGAGMAQLAPAVLTLSLKADQLDHANATTVLSIVVAISAVFGLVAAPVFGRVSDRLTWGAGRRRPLLVLGAVLMAIGAPLSYAAGSVAVLVVANVLTFLGVSAVTVACTAILADQYAPGRRGPASALIGLSLPVGALVGLFIAQLVSSSLLAQFLIPAAIAVVAAILLAVRLPDRNNIAKDMGIMGLASTLPASIVPALAPVLLAIGATAAHPQNFPALFLTGAVAGLIGAVLILPIRGVK